MISGNRMVKKNPNSNIDQKPVIHKLSDYAFDHNSGGNAYQVLKPKKQNLNKVDDSLKSSNPQIQDRRQNHRNSQNTEGIKNIEKPKFMSVARHGLKIGGLVIGQDKWHCKVCKLVNLNSTSQCLRCQSDKGELKQSKNTEQNLNKQKANKNNLINKQSIKNKPV
ncbi:hypothetical protein TTHERM_00471330 (macronuclear) [Tetrahymena thermophila SB210]|uniref:RanBP2-type domain-containing protein n=1 Tax=Tetrahymena thermophila (strain SB210) TaxID=312017 RepID=I7M025_TETTS|nr:hypothetical protein TTHERM_00471330 [Tetrahymena thermophila SB210]EAR85357.2 hypothetical protein TTHERM_00471330 [Tetrahymena thermophila SB210]|eukprot:XP_001033020.2 hypothetical protein TTHERM_00471330 [Tetrahymena thermophila SB210]